MSNADAARTIGEAIFAEVKKWPTPPPYGPRPVAPFGATPEDVGRAAIEAMRSAGLVLLTAELRSAIYAKFGPLAAMFAFIDAWPEPPEPPYWDTPAYREAQRVVDVVRAKYGTGGDNPGSSVDTPGETA